MRQKAAVEAAASSRGEVALVPAPSRTASSDEPWEVTYVDTDTFEATF